MARGYPGSAATNGRRLVFTYGWQRADVQIPPGSTTVEVDLVTRDDGAPLLTLVHRGLEDGAADAHQGGWRHYLNRLRGIAEGEEVGPDRWANFNRRAEPFAPNGRRFREWAAVRSSRQELWPSLLDEALAFVAAQ